MTAKWEMHLSDLFLVAQLAIFSTLSNLRPAIRNRIFDLSTLRESQRNRDT